MLPGLGSVIVGLHTLVELAGDAADDRFVPGIGESQAAGSQASDVVARLYQDDGPSHSRDLDRRRDPGRGPSIDDNVDACRSGRATGSQGREK